MSRDRLEAFSDGVFAVAITLLVLDIQVPPVKKAGSLADKLIAGDLWPHYAAYVVSFLTVGIIWSRSSTPSRSRAGPRDQPRAVNRARNRPVLTPLTRI
jgi:uncharacterized membrane protein